MSSMDKVMSDYDLEIKRSDEVCKLQEHQT